MRVLVVDDERLARLELRRLLAAHPVEVVGEASGVAEACAAAARLRPNVVFLDVQMRGESGFDFLASFADPRLRVVLVTAHPDFAVRGFDWNVLDYLLKPVNPARLAETIRRLGVQAPSRRADDPAATTLLKTGGATRLVAWREIGCVFAEGNYTRVALGDGGACLVLRSLKEWEALAPDGAFARVHRGCLARIDWIREVRPAGRGDHELLLANGEIVPVGRAFWPDLKRRLS